MTLPLAAALAAVMTAHRAALHVLRVAIKTTMTQGTTAPVTRHRNAQGFSSNGVPPLTWCRFLGELLSSNSGCAKPSPDGRRLLSVLLSPPLSDVSSPELLAPASMGKARLRPASWQRPCYHPCHAFQSNSMPNCPRSTQTVQYDEPPLGLLTGCRPLVASPAPVCLPGLAGRAPSPSCGYDLHNMYLTSITLHHDIHKRSMQQPL